MDFSDEQNTRDLCESAYAAGQLLARTRDWDLLAANVAIGYRDAILATFENELHRPAYTGSEQIGPRPATTGEPNLPADQEEQRQARIEHWREILVCLSAVDEAVGEQIDAAARQARRDGLTWSMIGSCLGITKTAAHMRYGRASDMGDDTPRAI